MPEKVIFDYIDSDPLAPVTLINPASNKKVKAYAYLDTGSDTVVVPRELWLKLGLEMLYRSSVCAVGGIVTSWYTRINMEIADALISLGMSRYAARMLGYLQNVGEVEKEASRAAPARSQHCSEAVKGTRLDKQEGRKEAGQRNAAFCHNGTSYFTTRNLK